MTLVIFLGSLLGSMALGIPIAFALLLVSVALMLHLDMFDAQIVARHGKTRCQRFSRSRHPAHPVVIGCKVKITRRAPPFDFDKSNKPASARDDIHLAPRALHPLRQNAPASEPQIPRSQPLPSPPLGFALSTAAHFSSSARA